MRSVFEFVILASSVVGIVSVAHLATLMVSSKRVSPLEMTKIGTTIIAIAIAVVLATRPRSAFGLWLGIQVPLVIGVFAAIRLSKRRDRALEEIFDEVLLALSMAMREGRSLRTSLTLISMRAHPKQRASLIEIERSVSFSTQKYTVESAWRVAVVSELRRIDALSHSQIVELDRWRHRLRSDRNFRRRSGQAMAQVQAQSLVLGFLFAALVVFSSIAFGREATWSSLRFALPLFGAGVLWIWRGGRRVRWTV